MQNVKTKLLFTLVSTTCSASYTESLAQTTLPVAKERYQACLSWDQHRSTMSFEIKMYTHNYRRRILFTSRENNRDIIFTGIYLI